MAAKAKRSTVAQSWGQELGGVDQQRRCAVPNALKNHVSAHSFGPDVLYVGICQHIDSLARSSEPIKDRVQHAGRPGKDSAGMAFGRLHRSARCAFSFGVIPVRRRIDSNEPPNDGL